ncbi:MAG: hypothetical protein IV090_19875 [Candidatus Sericytochromatia bacterium]|nr:hypothetical protein [Candidatus Sericytochromatia bacterium]
MLAEKQLTIFDAVSPSGTPADQLKWVGQQIQFLNAELATDLTPAEREIKMQALWAALMQEAELHNQIGEQEADPAPAAEAFWNSSNFSLIPADPVPAETRAGDRPSLLPLAKIEWPCGICRDGAGTEIVSASEERILLQCSNAEAHSGEISRCRLSWSNKAGTGSNSAPLHSGVGRRFKILDHSNSENVTATPFEQQMVLLAYDILIDDAGSNGREVERLISQRREIESSFDNTPKPTTEEPPIQSDRPSLLPLAAIKWRCVLCGGHSELVSASEDKILLKCTKKKEHSGEIDRVGYGWKDKTGYRGGPLLGMVEEHFKKYGQSTPDLWAQTILLAHDIRIAMRRSEIGMPKLWWRENEAGRPATAQEHEMDVSNLNDAIEAKRAFEASLLAQPDPIKVEAETAQKDTRLYRQELARIDEFIASEAFQALSPERQASEHRSRQHLLEYLGEAETKAAEPVPTEPGAAEEIRGKIADLQARLYAKGGLRPQEWTEINEEMKALRLDLADLEPPIKIRNCCAGPKGKVHLVPYEAENALCNYRPLHHANSGWIESDETLGCDKCHKVAWAGNYRVIGYFEDPNGEPGNSDKIKAGSEKKARKPREKKPKQAEQELDWVEQALLDAPEPPPLSAERKIELLRIEIATIEGLEEKVKAETWDHRVSYENKESAASRMNGYANLKAEAQRKIAALESELLGKQEPESEPWDLSAIFENRSDDERRDLLCELIIERLTLGPAHPHDLTLLSPKYTQQIYEAVRYLAANNRIRYFPGGIVGLLTAQEIKERTHGRLDAADREAIGGTCRQCGCTDHDCTQCVQENGFPCYWAEPDLCSRCAYVPTEDVTV